MIAIYKTARISDRPPHVRRLPRYFPLSQFIGATPTSAAIDRRLSLPSSGRLASKDVDNTSPTPGTLRRRLSCSRQSGLLRTALPKRELISSRRSSSHAICCSMSFRTDPNESARRFFSMTSIPIKCLRRDNKALNSCVCSSFSGLASGRTCWPKKANTCASILSVFANLPVARAKSRACRGLMTETGCFFMPRAQATGI